MCIPTNRERKAAVDFWVDGAQVRVLQSAACQHGLLRTVESNGTKLFPVADELIFDNDLVDRKLALGDLVSRVLRVGR